MPHCSAGKISTMCKVTVNGPKTESCHICRGPHCSQPLPQHICFVCGKAWSSAYQAQHPPIPGNVPVLGICSRQKYAKVGYSTMTTEPHVSVVIIHWVHYHYHISSGSSTSNLSAIVPVELPGKGELCHKVELPEEEVPNIKGYLEKGLFLFLEEPSSPSICKWSKLTAHNALNPNDSIYLSNMLYN